ncbi:MAG: pantoate--beta-alanine ligase [Nitrospiraceae bacterium]|nr:MAG: pantoate--beta-alanine ligase [Nitrospiraceae bacterium]
MQLIKTVNDMQDVGRWFRGECKTIGFVPTMGALHEGHLSLVRRSKEENDRTVVSIFINPTQFGPNEDFEKYPRDIEGDLSKLSAINTDVVFMPETGEMYPEGFSVSVDMGAVGKVLCGASRPGHFNAVATVVAKLINVVMPHRVYMGQKDFQQTVIIKKLVRELNADTKIVVSPTVRETDGLALSSRNMYLNEQERKAALILYKALKLGEELVLSRGMDESGLVKKEMEAFIKTEPLAKTEYVDIVDAYNLAPVQRVIFAAVICIAVRIGKTRLIDNIIIEKG